MVAPLQFRVVFPALLLSCTVAIHLHPMGIRLCRDICLVTRDCRAYDYNTEQLQCRIIDANHLHSRNRVQDAQTQHRVAYEVVQWLYVYVQQLYTYVYV